MNVTAPAWAALRFNPARLGSKVAAARWMTCGAGVSGSGRAAKRVLCGIGNDSNRSCSVHPQNDGAGPMRGGLEQAPVTAGRPGPAVSARADTGWSLQGAVARQGVPTGTDRLECRVTPRFARAG
jgi:hypothetical protein